MKLGYFAQQAVELLTRISPIWEQIEKDFPHESIGVLRNLLGAFQFSGDDVDKKIRALSGGEKTRLVMARMLLDPPNFLVLDEPTNHLDLATKEMLVKSLRGFRGDDDLRVARPHVPARAEQSRARAGRGERDGHEPHAYPGSYIEYVQRTGTRPRACTPERYVLTGAASRVPDASRPFPPRRLPESSPCAARRAFARSEPGFSPFL